MTHFNDGDEITVEVLQEALVAIGHQLAPGEIVLLRTDADKRLETEEYFQQPGLGRAGTLWLVEQGIRVIGIDAYTIDRPFHSMKQDFQESGDGRVIWPAHFAGITKEYCQIEKLANLDQLPFPTASMSVVCPSRLPRPVPGGVERWQWY